MTPPSEPVQPPIEGADGYLGTERLLAFSDGVFAVAITLLVFDLMRPSVEHGLVYALARLWPHYLSFALSFLLIGIIWANHHHIFTHVKRANHTFLMINVIFLLWVVFIPFPTALLAEYLSNSGERRTVMVIYSATFLVLVLLFNLLWRYGTYNFRLTGPNPDMDAIAKTNQSYIIGPIVYTLNVPLSFISPEAGLVVFLLASLGYALSPFPGSRPNTV